LVYNHTECDIYEVSDTDIRVIQCRYHYQKN